MNKGRKQQGKRNFKHTSLNKRFKTYLLEANVVRPLSEALSAHHQIVLSDQTLLVAWRETNEQGVFKHNIPMSGSRVRNLLHTLHLRAPLEPLIDLGWELIIALPPIVAIITNKLGQFSTRMKRIDQNYEVYHREHERQQ
jgi:hypothetical protein